MIDALIKYAIYAAILGAVAFGLHQAWDAFKDRIGLPYAEAQRAADEPKINAALARATSAEAAVGKQTAAAQQKADADAEAQQRTAAALAALAKTAAARKAEIDKLVGIAAGPPAPQTCEAELADTNSILDGILAGRVRH